MSRYDRDRERDNCKVYVGNLGKDASRSEIEQEFKRFGQVKEVWVARNPPGFAYVTFEDPLDAEDSIKELDGSDLCGERVRVEHARGPRRGGRGGRGPPRDRYYGGGGGGGRYGGGGGGYRDGGYGGGGGGRRRFSRSRSRSRSPYRRDRYDRDRDRDSRY